MSEPAFEEPPGRVPDRRPSTPPVDLRLTVEDAEDALLEGDRTFAAGTARAALSYPTFRRVFFGAFLSNIGSWMQNVVLGAFGYKLTGSAMFVTLLAFAQLVPADAAGHRGRDARRPLRPQGLLIIVSIEQTDLRPRHRLDRRSSPTRRSGCCSPFVLAIGIGQAVYAPAFGSVVPQLVDKKDLAGAVSLNSVNMNLSRVIGPAIGSLIYARFGVSWVFVGNAVSYLFIIGALLMVRAARRRSSTRTTPRARAACSAASSPPATTRSWAAAC